jgi:hypothetical protein
MMRGKTKVQGLRAQGGCMRSNLILFVLVLVLVLVLVNQNFIGEEDDEGGSCRAVAQRAKEAKTTDHGQQTFSGEKL